ncbi:MAG TPA: ESX secretion-associated protein EspG [Pseudonocardiaceae bacterium]
MITSVELTTAQYDIVWHDLKLGEQPYPVAVRSQGRTMEERALIRNRVYGELTARRLAEGPRVGNDLANALTLLARAPVSLDMIWLPELDAKVMRNALVVADGDHGMLAETTGEGVRLRAIRGAALIPALLDLLPRVPAAPGRSITVPTESLVPSGAPEQQGDSIYEPSRPAASTATQQVRSLEAMFARPRLRGGQIVANALDRHGRRTRSRPLEWFDTEDGRCMAQTGAGIDGRQHLLVAPADAVRIANRLRDMLDAVRMPPNG